jgi:hypothetical protein
MDNNPTHRPQRRAYFRIVYPAELRASLFISGQRFVVLDVSEKGVRIANPLNSKLPDGEFRAIIKLNQGDPIDVFGRVIRIDKNQVALILLRGIPYNAILAEQVLLRQGK